MDVFRIFAAQETSIGDGAVEMMQANVICAALQQGCGDGDAQRLDHGGNIAAKKLILQILGTGRNDHLAAGLQRGNKVGVSFAGTGARLGHQHAGTLDGRINFFRHFDLAQTVTESFNIFGERPVRTKDDADF